MIRWLIPGAALVVAAGAWAVTAPDPLPDDALSGLTPDPANGESVFIAAGCASCHVAPDTEAVTPAPILAGGKRFETAFGTFVAPNISSHPETGIGDWSDLEIANAVQRGVAPNGAHYYPAFPYLSYERATPQDMVDLIAHLRSLPADPTPSLDHEVGFPFSIRRALGAWKRLAAPPDRIGVSEDPQETRGRYLVEALGHCGECHTPRNSLGMPDHDAWLTGADLPTGDGRVPGITPATLGWSAFDIAEYLTSGFTPEFDTAGGDMVEVIENISRLPRDDREAIAAYLVSIDTAE